MEGFVCQRINGARLTLAGCSAKHKRVSGDGPPRQALRSVELISPCLGCRVGAQHELGRRPRLWPDGSPIVRLRIDACVTAPVERPVLAVVDRGAELLVSPAEARTKRAARAKVAAKRVAKPKSEYIQNPRGSRYEFRGEMLSVAQLLRTPEAVAAGLTYRSLWHRLHPREGERPWSVEEAVSSTAGRRIHHQRRGRLYPFRGAELTLMDLWLTPECQAAGITRKCLRQRLVGFEWPAERAVTTPALNAGNRGPRSAA